MPKILIVVEASGEEMAESLTERMLSAQKHAIITSAYPHSTVEVVAANSLQHTIGVDLESKPSAFEDLASNDFVLCPLTLNLPDMPFQALAVYKACRDVTGLRQRAQQHGIAIANGCFWLPIVLTAKGTLYGEVIGLQLPSEERGQSNSNSELTYPVHAIDLKGKQLPEDLSLSDLSYYQPFHLSDGSRQQLYQMGRCLLQLLSAPPATYLVQFGFLDSGICFDRLWPFPAAPAIASLGVQEPDLFTCHWYCLTGLPVLDLAIIPSSLADGTFS